MTVVTIMEILLVLALGVIVLSFLSSPIEHRQKRKQLDEEDILGIRIAIIAIIIVSVIISIINLLEVLI